MESLFQFSGMNPDAGLTIGENIAGLQLTNTSEEYLRTAAFTAELADGTILTFRVEDVPPGKTVMAFCLENKTVEHVTDCVAIRGQGEFEPSVFPGDGLVEIAVNGMAITLTNVSGVSLTNLNVTCHGLLDNSYFGGTAYHYTVDSLSAGQSTVIYAVDCILGMTEVTCVEEGG